jgi:hypothetical protein
MHLYLTSKDLGSPCTQFITLENWNHYGSWAAHLGGATALLQLQGQEQFNCERRGQLFMQLRSQIVSLSTYSSLTQ